MSRRVTPEPRPARTRRVAVLALLAAGLAAGCEEVEQLEDRFRDLTPHEAYRASLDEAGLTQTALGRDWIEAGRRVLDEPVPVTLPFREEGFIAAEDPGAVGYRLAVGKGQRLTADVTLTTDEGTRVFVDLLRVPEDPRDPLRPVISTDSVPGSFVHEPFRGGEFVLRIQPELLRGGRYEVTLRLEAQLAFPVEGRDTRAIQSFWGAARDGGARSHHGVDIFAPRGTPVLAASQGRVSRVRVTPRGGRVVWLRDGTRNASIYYAHLDSQAVVDGQLVEVGDTVGFVGNSGNARTTPPHLHFGIYRRGEGPTDPLPFIRRPPGTLAERTAPGEELGRWVRTRPAAGNVRFAPSGGAERVRVVARHTAARVLGASGGWFRVMLPDGATGYLFAAETEPADGAVDTRVAQGGEPVRALPAAESPVVREMPSGARVAVLGRFQDYLLVRGEDGASGWMAPERGDPDS